MRSWRDSRRKRKKRQRRLGILRYKLREENEQSSGPELETRYGDQYK